MMRVFDKVRFSNLDRRILQLSILTSVIIAVLGAGVLAFMYPTVFGYDALLPDAMFRNAFYGFGGLSTLLSLYIIDRQLTIMRLRCQIAENRIRFTTTQREATTALLAGMPNLSAFHGRLVHEFRRVLASQKRLSAILVVLQLPGDYALPSERLQIIGDAAAAATRTLRKLCNEDTFYLLDTGCLGVVLPEFDLEMAEATSRRISEGLSNAAGAGYRFYFKLEIVNYPANAVSAHEMQQVVKSIIVAEHAARDLPQAVN